MTQKCYRVQFTAYLHKLTLALKMQCQIQILWKRGEKSASSDKVPLINGEVNFDKKISISCNMKFNTKTKTFHEKITKFYIIITSQKGVKQAGEISFDVGQYVNQTQLSKKDYDEKLTGCPDKNAKLTYTISGVMKEQISPDDMSQPSISPLIDDKNISVIESEKIAMKKKPQTYNNFAEVPTQDKPKPQKKDERVRQIEDQNKKMREQLKASEKLRQQNEQLRRKIKAEEFKKASEVKEKMQKYKKEIEKMKSQIRANKKIEDETLNIEKDIFKCKVKIMKAFNYACESGGERLVDALHQNCGYTEK